MKFVIPVTPDGQVGHSWGKAETLAVATWEDGAITSWDVHDVRWDLSHGEGNEGAHHARVVRFLKEQEIEYVVVDHMGAPMRNTINKLGLKIVPTEEGQDARKIIEIAATRL